MNQNSIIFQLIEASPYPQILVTPDYPDFTVAYVNQSLLNASSISRDEVIGKGVLELSHRLFDKAHAESIISGLKQVLDEKKSNENAISINTKWKAKNEPLFNDKGELEYILRTASEIGLITNEGYKSIFKQAADAIFISTGEGYLLEVNDKACAMFGYSREELLTLHAKDLVSKDDLEATPLLLKDLPEKKSIVHERKAIRKDGSIFFISLSATLLHNGDVLTIARDITNRRVQAQALKQSENRLKAMFNHEPNCVKIVDKELVVLDMNAAGLEIIEAECESEIIGKEVLPLIAEEHRSSYSNAHLKAYHGTPSKVVFKLIGLKGGVKWMESQAVPFTDYKNNSKCILCITRDITDEKEANDLLKKSMERFELAASATNDAIWDWDKVNNKTWGNKRLHELYGRKNDTGYFNSDTFFPQVHPDDREELISRLNTALKNKAEKVSGEYRFKTSTGEYRHFFDQALIAYNDLGEAVRVLGAMQDITERKKSEEALLKSDQKYRYLFNNNPLPMFIYNFETLKIVDCNIAACRKYGYTREEFLELTIKDIRPVEKIPQIEKATSIVVKAGDFHQGVWEHMTKDGRLMNMEITNHIIDHEGELSALVLANDITEKFKASQELLKSNRRLKSSNRIAQLGYWEFDLASKKVSWSKELFKITQIGKNKKSVSIENCFKIIHPDNVETITNLLNQCIEKQQANESYFKLIWPNNEIRHIHAVIRISKVENNMVTVLEGTLQDVTERIEYIKAIEDQNEKFRKIAWIQSHVVRAPLAKIVGVANLIKQNSLSEIEKEELLTHLLDSSAELDQIIRDIVEIAEQVRIDANG